MARSKSGAEVGAVPLGSVLLELTVCAPAWNSVPVINKSRITTAFNSAFMSSIRAAIQSASSSEAFTQLTALSRPVTLPALRCAIPRFCDLSIRTDAGLRVQAPKQPLIGSWNGGVGLRQNELPLPTKCRTKVRMISIEAIKFALHAAPPAAFNMARFRATRAS